MNSSLKSADNLHCWHSLRACAPCGEFRRDREDPRFRRGSCHCERSEAVSGRRCPPRSRLLRRLRLLARNKVGSPIPLSAGVVPLTQLRVKLGFASPTLRNPLPQWAPNGGEGRVRGLLAQSRQFHPEGRPPAGVELAMTAFIGVVSFLVEHRPAQPIRLR
jgi:hypothetical protein